MPRGAYSSTEEAVLKVTNALNVNVRPEDIEISHHIRLKRNEAIIVKFVSHKVKSRVYKAPTRLKNVSVTGLFQDCPATSRTESNRIHMCESLTAYRRYLVNKLKTKQRNNELLSVWTMDGKVLSKRHRKARQLEYPAMKTWIISKIIRSRREVSMLKPDRTMLFVFIVI